MSILRLAWINLRRDLRGNLLSVAGVAAGIGALVFFVGLGLGVGDVVRTKIFPGDARSLEVVPPRVQIGLFGATVLDEEAVSRFSALPGVEAVHRKMRVRIPAVSRYDGSFFGKHLRMGLEILAEGVDPGLVDAGERFEDGGEDAPIPALISTRLLEIYNQGFARERGLPQVSGAMLQGFRFPVDFGRSYVTARAARGEALRQEAVLAGASERAMLQGITIPLESARRLNARLGEDARTYSALVLRATTPDRVPAIAAAVREAGFGIDDTERVQAERVGAAVAIVTAVLALLSLLVCGLGCVNISLTLGAAVRARSRELGILRSVGATSGAIGGLVLAEAGAIGLCGGVAGALTARGAASLVDWLARTRLPPFPFKPETFFVFPGWVWVGAVATGLAAALLGALVPAGRAVRVDPSRIL
ncbi:MAG TPA: ABC transporter permease [Vulgatibacter sp.]|nr:ABC transporter permease [Vulgatibacter sp.]